MNLGKNRNIAKIASKVIREYCLKNGVTREDIALDMGIVKGTLENKLKPSDVNNSLYAEEILKICEITDDDAILKAMCAERGLVVIDPIEAMPEGGDVVHTIVMGVLDIDVDTGHLSRRVHEALEDGEIDASEAKALRAELLKIIKISRTLELTLKNHEKEIL